MADKKITKTIKKHQAAPIDNSYGHLQPQAIEIERVVIGALLIDKDAFTVVSEIIRPETFYDPRHQKMYAAIQQLNYDELYSCIHLLMTRVIKGLWTNYF